MFDRPTVGGPVSLSLDQPIQVVVFCLDDRRFGLPLASVDTVLRAAAVTPLPKAPEIVLGMINWAGRIVPIVDIRKRFRLPERELDVHNQIIIAHTGKRRLGLVVDSVSDLVELTNQQVTAAEQVLPGLEYVEGVARFKDGLVLIHDLEKFLSLEEERGLTGALVALKGKP